MVLNFPTSPINGQVSNDFYFDSSVGTEGAWRSSPVPIGGLPAGSIIQWAGSTAPANWLIADGSAVSRTANASLFAVIGTTYGSGDGSTTFNLPDLRGRVAVGKNGGTFGTLGATGGAETHTLTIDQMPSHGHGVGGRNVLSGGSGTNANLNTTGSSWVFTPFNAEGGGQAHNILQPYLVTNYIIKATAGWSAGDSELAQRVGVLEAAPAGLVRVVPTSVAVGSGSASVSSTGVVTFTGASSVSLNGCFTSAFRNYRVMVNLSATSVTQGVALRARTGTTDRTANYYYQGWRTSMTNATSTWTSDNNTFFHLGDIGLGNADRFNSVVDVLSPNIARATTAIWQSHFDNSSTISNVNVGGSIQTTNIDDGLTLFATGGGTIAGEIQVYGYRN